LHDLNTCLSKEKIVLAGTKAALNEAEAATAKLQKENQGFQEQHQSYKVSLNHYDEVKAERDRLTARVANLLSIVDG